MASATPSEPPQGPRIVGSRVRYAQPLSAYEAVYGVDDRTLKRLIKLGREVSPPDLPPFHLPADMPAWWTRRKPHRAIPDYILLAASKGTPPPPPPAPAAAPKPAPVAAAQPDLPGTHAPPPPPAPRDFSKVKALGIEENVQALRESLAITLQLLNEARLGDDEGLIASRQKGYQSAFSELRKAENDLIDWQKQTGVLCVKSDVKAESTRIAGAIFGAVMRLVTAVRPKLHGKTDPEQDALWKDEVVKCFVTLRDCNFVDYGCAISGA
jgi:hypothetical protein